MKSLFNSQNLSFFRNRNILIYIILYLLEDMKMKDIYLRSRSIKRLLLSIGQKGKFIEENLQKNDIDKKTIDDDDEKCIYKETLHKPTWRCFSFEEIHQATNGFHNDNLVGKGGYSEVYRGGIQGQTIAVKRLRPGITDEHKERDFLIEIGTVCHVSHYNVCAFLGYCIDSELYLVFEFSSLGSVSANLHDEKTRSLDWKIRYKIAVGTARGLEYLHKGCQRRIIHRDIKASNVLLTSNYDPQISDFGLAKWLPTDWAHRAVAPIEGTFGCLAPEYFTHGIIDEKTDVFAFGVFLLELITGRKPVDGSHRSLLSWTKPFIKDENIRALVDPRLGDDFDQDELKRLVFIASLCIRALANWRPCMTEVLELLECAEIKQDQWKMPDEEEEFWDFDDLNDSDDDNDTPSSLSSASI